MTSVQIYIDSIIDYVRVNYKKDITLKELSERFRLNKYAISREFNHATGQTLPLYIQSLRIQTAKELSRNPKLRAKEIAELSGFKSFSQFTRAFKQQTGLTLKSFRGNNLIEPGNHKEEFNRLIKGFYEDLVKGKTGFNVSFDQWLQNNRIYIKVGNKYARFTDFNGEASM